MRDITWQIWLPDLKETIHVVLSRLKEGLTFGGLFQKWSLERTDPGEMLLGVLRAGSGMEL